MPKVELWCSMYDEIAVFSVKISRDAEVKALLEAVVKKKQDENDRFKVDPSMNALYLARKNGKWFKGDGTLVDILGTEITSNYEEMNSSWKLNTTELFGPDFKTIHCCGCMVCWKAEPNVRGFVYGSWYDLGGERTQFIKLLTDDDPSRRPTAAAALDRLRQLEQTHLNRQTRDERNKRQRRDQLGGMPNQNRIPI